MDHNQITPIVDQDDLNRLGNRLADIFQKTYDGRFILLKKKDWLAVPCEENSAGHLSDGICERISFTASKDPYLFAYSLERMRDFPNAFRVPVTASALNEVNFKLNILEYALFPPDMSWLVVCPSGAENYFFVIGTASTISSIVGTDIMSAYSSFEAFVPLSSHPTEISIRGSILNELKNTYSSAHEGTLIRFPEQVFGKVTWPPAFLRK